MKKSIKSALVATVVLIAANIMVINTVSAGNGHVRLRNTILGLGLLGFIANSHRHNHHDHGYVTYDHGYRHPRYRTYYDERGPYYYERAPEGYTEY